MRLRFWHLILLAIISSVFALGFRISPGTILLYDAPVGKPYDFAMERNQTIRIGPVEGEITYELHSEKPSMGNSSATGYFDFPEPIWFSFGAETITVEAGKISEIPMWLNIPMDEGLYNHNWLLGIPVTPIAVAKGATQIQVGGYLQFRIETQAKENVIPKCGLNEIVAVPSKLAFENMQPGIERVEVATLFHEKLNSSLYTVERLDPSSDVAKLTILGSPSYPRLTNPEWIEYPKEIVIPGSDEGGGPLPITLKIPADAQVRRFEEILLIKSNKTKTAFLRVLVDIEQF